MTTPILDLWLKGVKLSQAPYAFSSSDDKEEHARLHQVSKDKLVMQSYKRAQSAGLAGVDLIRAVTDEVGPITSGQVNLQKRMHNFVRKHLKLGNLYGYGFEPPRKIDSQPFEIPAYCWAGHIQWYDDVLTADRLELAHIRVLSTAARSRLINSEVENANPSKPGRPGYKTQILKAYAALNAAGKIDVQNSLQSHYPSVREWLETNLSDAAPNDNTLQRHLSPIFNALKKNSKL